MSRQSRVLAAIIAMFSLLFAQLAVASYVCPDLRVAASSQQAATQAMPDCTNPDMNKPNLCQAHCDTGHQSVDTPAAPAVAPFVACGLAVVLPDLSVIRQSSSLFVDTVFMVRVTSPPVAIRNCCFRI